MANTPVFPLLDKSDLPQALHAQWERSLERRGEARFIAGVGQANHAYNWYMQSFYKDLFYGGDVPVRYKELGRLRLSSIHGCRSCNRGNRLDAREHGLSDEQIRSIDDPSRPAFDDADRAVLALADLVSLEGKGRRLDKKTYGMLSAHFTNGQIIELAMTLSMLAGMAQFLFAFELVEQEDYCEF